MPAVPIWVVDLVYSIIIFAIAAIVGETLIAFIRRAGQRAPGGVVATRLVRQVIRIGWILLAGLGILTVWGVAPDLLAALVFAVLALVVSLSLTTTFQNMISGIFLLQDGVVRVGDRIEHFWIKGVVVRVALRNTWVRTESGEIAVVGNLKLADGPTLNYDLAPRFQASDQAGPPIRLFHDSSAPSANERKRQS